MFLYLSMLICGRINTENYSSFGLKGLFSGNQIDEQATNKGELP